MSWSCQSMLTPKTYIRALRSNFSFPLGLYGERVTGIAIGRFFSVAYYAPWEWNRRITSECSRAIGYVRKTEKGSEIRFIRSKGLFSPFWLLFWTLFGALVFAVKGGELTLFSWIICCIVSFVICGVTAFQDSLTEAGQEGAGIISALLEKPEEFYYC